MAVASTPAPRTNGHRGASSARDAASAMMTISKVAQPRHCRTLSPVGRALARRPSSPRSSTIAGTRSRAAGAAVRPSSTAPITAPTAMASRLTPSGRPASTTKDAATGSSRLTPRLAHRPRVSRRPSSCEAGSARVRGASARAAVIVNVSPYAGMTRTGSSGRRRVQPSSQPGRPGLPHTAPPTLRQPPRVRPCPTTRCGPQRPARPSSTASATARCPSRRSTPGWRRTRCSSPTCCRSRRACSPEPLATTRRCSPAAASRSSRSSTGSSGWPPTAASTSRRRPCRRRWPTATCCSASTAPRTPMRSGACTSSSASTSRRGARRCPAHPRTPSWSSTGRRRASRRTSRGSATRPPAPGLPTARWSTTCCGLEAAFWSMALSDGGAA